MKISILDVKNSPHNRYLIYFTFKSFVHGGRRYGRKGRIGGMPLCILALWVQPLLAERWGYWREDRIYPYTFSVLSDHPFVLESQRVGSVFNIMLCNFTLLRSAQQGKEEHEFWQSCVPRTKGSSFSNDPHSWSSSETNPDDLSKALSLVPARPQ